MPLPSPGAVFQENDPRIERFVRVLAVRGDRVKIIRINRDGSPYKGTRETYADLFRFDSPARGKYRFVSEPTEMQRHSAAVLT